MSRALASSAAPRPARPVSRRPPRAARSLPRASALRVTPPAASSPDETRRGSAAWGDAWGSVADPNTRVAYVDDAERDALRRSLARSGLFETLEATADEFTLRGEMRAPDARALADRDLLAGDERADDDFDFAFARVGLADALASTPLPPGVSPARLALGIAELERDVARVCSAYCASVGSPSAVFELSLLRRTLCSKLHVDHVPLRVMVTYFGAGTEVLSQGASDAVARLLAPGARFVGEAAKGVAMRASRRRTARECEVVLMKGERWPGNEGRAIVHRSPDVDGCCGEWRLCLKVDEPKFVNDVE